MILSAVKWKNFHAIKIVNAHCELIVSMSVGPRIVSLKYKNSENLLYEDFTGFGVNEWLLYGGHRFTIAPESAASYLPDNLPCIVKTRSHYIKIAAPARPDQLQLSLQIDADNDGFRLTHTLANRSSEIWTGALWAITCVPRSSLVTASCGTDQIEYWPGTDESEFFVQDDLIHLKPGEFRGKIGWHQSSGWLSATKDRVRLTIRHDDETSAKDCVDNGCNLEMFTCKDWIELETVGQIVTVSPRTEVRHHQTWLLSDEASLSHLIR